MVCQILPALTGGAWYRDGNHESSITQRCCKRPAIVGTRRRRNRERRLDRPFGVLDF